MKKLIVTALLLLLTGSLFLTGCSDDDDDVVAGTAAQATILGYANLYPYAYFYIDVMPLTNGDFMIDSAFAFDSTCLVRNDSYWYVYGDDNYQWVEYYNSDDTSRYHSGDDVTIDIYNNGNLATTQITLLDYYDDFPPHILPATGDTINLNSSINCIWNSVTNADWYGIRMRYRKDSSGTQVYTYTYAGVTDTSYTIPGSLNGYNGYYDIYIIAVSGPVPDGPANMNSAGIIGDIVSYTTYQTNLRIYVGTGDPTPVGGMDFEPETETPEVVAKELMDNILKKEGNRSITLPQAQLR